MNRSSYFQLFRSSNLDQWRLSMKAQRPKPSRNASWVTLTESPPISRSVQPFKARKAHVYLNQWSTGQLLYTLLVDSLPEVNKLGTIAQRQRNTLRLIQVVLINVTTQFEISNYEYPINSTLATVMATQLPTQISKPNLNNKLLRLAQTHELK